MARRKMHPEAVRIKSGLAERLKRIRIESFGERGGPELARNLGLPIRTWYNYEGGVTVPAEVVLKFIEFTGVHPIWLLHGRGEPFPPKASGQEPAASAGSVEDLLRIALNRLEGRSRLGRAEGGPEAARLGVPSTLDDLVFQDVERTAGDLSASSDGPRLHPTPRSWLAAGEVSRCLLVKDGAMLPILGPGACVGYRSRPEPPDLLDGSMVVADVEGQVRIRWLQASGGFAILRPENPEADSPTILLELAAADDREAPRFHRVLWISTPH